MHVCACLCVCMRTVMRAEHLGVKKMAETNALSPDPVSALLCMEPSVTVFQSAICIHESQAADQAFNT